MWSLINAHPPAGPLPLHVCPIAGRPSCWPPAGAAIAPSPQLEPSAPAPSHGGATRSKPEGVRGSPCVGPPAAPPLCRTTWPRRAAMGSSQVPEAGGATVPTGPRGHAPRLASNRRAGPAARPRCARCASSLGGAPPVPPPWTSKAPPISPRKRVKASRGFPKSPSGRVGVVQPRGGAFFPAAAPAPHLGEPRPSAGGGPPRWPCCLIPLWRSASGPWARDHRPGGTAHAVPEASGGAISGPARGLCPASARSRAG